MLHEFMLQSMCCICSFEDQTINNPEITANYPLTKYRNQEFIQENSLFIQLSLFHAQWGDEIESNTLNMMRSSR